MTLYSIFGVLLDLEWSRRGSLKEDNTIHIVSCLGTFNHIDKSIFLNQSLLTLILRLYPFLRKKSTFLSNEYIFCKWTSFSTVMPNNSLKALSYQLRVYFYLPSPAICEIEKYHLGQRAIVWESQHKIKNMKKVFFMLFSQASKENKNSRFNLFLYLLPLLQK